MSQRQGDDSGTLRRSTSVYGVTLITLVACMLYAVVALGAEGWDPMRFVLLGPRYAEGDPDYRYQRVLYPLLARWLTVGQPDRIPYTLILVNVAAIALCAYTAWRILPRFGVGGWYASIGLAHGPVLYGGWRRSSRMLNYSLSRVFSLVYWSGSFARRSDRWKTMKAELPRISVSISSSSSYWSAKASDSSRV